VKPIDAIDESSVGGEQATNQNAETQHVAHDGRCEVEIASVDANPEIMVEHDHGGCEQQDDESNVYEKVCDSGNPLPHDLTLHTSVDVDVSQALYPPAQMIRRGLAGAPKLDMP
jgi:hypothetical protein